ncbi:MAG: glycosyltransferase family 2 protein [Lachnospiraceae bacterium]|jgi:biofilm PGA synthesis N-glycosyltransferase PgaC|nr:glycosyltransferase family 2 protein [Lachnospiraceae bacterium]NBJ80853.1 glycosyltransferase family 2 protein [bacterium 1XD42-76]NBK04062.1 glycosyltransferase family 2 protein [bacterium 1XD42-94]
MSQIIFQVLRGMEVFFLLYLLLYASYLFLSVAMGAWRLYRLDRMRAIKNELKHEFYFPVSILVPAHNEEVTILDNVQSLLKLDYQLYEVIVVDDGSRDNTSQVLIDYFHMKEVSRPIRLSIPCKAIKAVYEAPDTRIRLTLLRKENGGKGDALNAGINASQYPYFLCIDADSVLQWDSLERIVQPVMEDDDVVAVGGLIRVAQCIRFSPGEGVNAHRELSYHLPWNFLTCMQVMEYDRSFLASRILLDGFNGNLIISGAFGLFKKNVVIAAGGYATDVLGEDMELVAKLHAYCRNNMERYSIRYEPNAVCWSQAPSTLPDLFKQRRRWHIGLFQCITRYRFMLLKSRFGMVGTVSYLYYLLYELYSPIIEVIGLAGMVTAAVVGMLNTTFMLRFYLLFAVYSSILTITAFFQRIYTQNIRISRQDVFRACIMCLIENIFFRFVFDFIRLNAFLGYRKNKETWGTIKRVRHNEAR